MITSLSGVAACPLALAAYPNQDPKCVARAFQGGMNYFFFYSLSAEQYIQKLASLLKKKRDEIIVATGSGSRKPSTLKTTRRKIMSVLGTDVVDLFFAEYISKADDERSIFDR